MAFVEIFLRRKRKIEKRKRKRGKEISPSLDPAMTMTGGHVDPPVGWQVHGF